MPISPKTKARKVQNTACSSASDHRAILARRLDMLAGAELQHGHHLAAEHLAKRAAMLREGCA